MKQLLLVGGGHAHVEVVRRFGLEPVPGWTVRVVSADAAPIYSGMVPGFVAGLYRADELAIDLPALCARAGASFVHDRVTRIDTRERRALLASGESVSFDLASLDVGSTVAGRELPGVAEYALASRPIAALVDDAEGRVGRLRDAAPGACRVVVVGAGAAGLELAFCLRERLRRAGVRRLETSVLDGAATILPGASRSLVARASRAMQRRGISLLLDREVAAVEADAVRLSNGSRVPADLVVWVTGPAALPLARDSSLPVDARGFVRIDASFEVEGQRDLFAVGDCASLAGMKRAGVYAVRAGPVLDHNLRARMSNRELRRYRPQADFLTLLTLGDGTAIGSKWGISVEGAWVMRLKDHIDRAFVAKYNTRHDETAGR